jgi:hypothetical protein
MKAACRGGYISWRGGVGHKIGGRQKSHTIRWERNESSTFANIAIRQSSYLRVSLLMDQNKIFSQNDFIQRI